MRLAENIIRDFMEYSIPTIEIRLEDTKLDEIIELFVDINQQGFKVTKFDIVKAMSENPLLKSVFGLISIEQKRKSDVFYKMRRTDFSSVLDKLQIMQNLPNQNSKVDRMWERLLEIVLFNRTRKHRAPAQILKSFIDGKSAADKAKISASELRQLQACFKFLRVAYSKADIAKSPFATDQTHFYTMATSILTSDFLAPNGMGSTALQGKLLAFSKILSEKSPLPKEKSLANSIRTYQEASRKQTTHPGQRGDRQRLFLEIINTL